MHNYLVSDMNINCIDVAFGEYLYATCILYIIEYESISKNNRLYNLVFGLLSSIGIISAYYGYQNASLATSGICNTLHSFIICIGAIIIFNERVSFLKALAYMIGIISIFNINYVNVHIFSYILLSNICFALVTLLQKHTRYISLKHAFLYTLYFITLYKILYMQNYNIIHIFDTSVLLVGLLSCIAQLMLQYAYRYHGLITLSIFGKVRPVAMILFDRDSIDISSILSLSSILLITLDMLSYQKGIYAEDKAVKFLVQYCRILMRRHRTPYGEIDILMLDQNTLVAVEVKSRKSYNEALYAITPRQYTRISHALTYTAGHLNHHGDLRIDRVLIVNNDIFWFKNIIL